MNSLIKLVIWMTAILALPTLYFAPNIYGYYRFKSICEKEGGLKVFQLLQRGVGWRTTVGLSQNPVAYFSAEYSRYQNKEGVLSDIRLISEKKSQYFDRDFKISVAESSKSPVYEYRESYEKVSNETRLLVTKTEVLDVATRSTLVIYKTFSYETFEQDRTLLGAASASSCPQHANFGPQDSQSRTTLGEKILAIASSVK